MNTNHPTTEIFFVFAHTYCKVMVYETEATFAKKLFEAAGAQLLEKGNEDYQETDTRVLFALVSQAFPKMLDSALPDKQELIQKALKAFAVKSS